MTKFIDGPAIGIEMALNRTPIMLRVVDENGTFDALSELNDFPNPREKVYCYVMSAYNEATHTCKTGWCPNVEYKLNGIQPTDEIMRNNDLWADWVTKQEAVLDMIRENLLDRSA